ncbi:MAG: helix-turn-helix domain-containing protein [Candidatus Omnitrophota bacterium]
MERIYINPYKLFIGAFLPNWLLSRPEKEISLGAKVCYAKLCQYAGKNGECFPNQTSIANDIGCGRRQVIRYIQELVGFQLIISVKVGFPGRNVYRFLYHDWMKSYPVRSKITPMDGRSVVTSVSQLDTTSCDIPDTPVVTQMVSPIYEENQLRESIESIYKHWNSLNLLTHRNFEKFKPVITSALKIYKLEEVKAAMSNYAMVVNGDKYFWKYKWTLDQFLDRKNGIDRFLPGNFKEKDYLKNIGKTNQDNSSAINEEYLSKKLGRIATKEMIKEVLRQIPQTQWWVVGKFLRRRYPASNGIDEVERELIAESRVGQARIAELTSGIAKAA